MQPPDISLKNNKAEIHFIISGPLTHVKVKNCVDGTEECVTENVLVPQKIMKYDFITELALAAPKAKRWLFLFWIYDDDVALNSEPIEIVVTKASSK